MGPDHTTAPRAAAQRLFRRLGGLKLALGGVLFVLTVGAAQGGQLSTSVARGTQALVLIALGGLSWRVATASAEDFFPRLLRLLWCELVVFALAAILMLLFGGAVWAQNLGTG